MEINQIELELPLNQIPKALTPAHNRVNYILRKHEKTKKRFDLSKLEVSTKPSDFNSKLSVNKSQEGKSQHVEDKFRVKKILKNPVESSWFKENDNQENRLNSSELRLAAKRRLYNERKSEAMLNNKLIKQQKQHVFNEKRSKKLKVLKLEETAREQISNFWEWRRRQQQTARDLRKIPDQISQVKIQQLKMKILKAEEESLDKFEEFICQQEELAYRIKSKLNLL